MAALDFTVMPGRVRLNELMSNPELTESSFKESFFVRTLSVQAIGKFRTVVGLDAFNGIREAFHTMLDEL